MPSFGLNETATSPSPEKPELPGIPPDADFQLSLRRLTYADLPAVISIERRSFTSPWSPGMFVLEVSKDSCVALAAVRDDQPVAYVILSRYDSAWYLMNIAVAPEHRRYGIASLLIRAAIGEIEPGAPVTLEVRPSNRSAIRLYEGLGFRTYGYRHGYYPDNGEDAMIMWLGDPAQAGVPDQALPAEPGG